MLILIAILAFLSTLIGGLFALQYRDKLHLVLGFSAGAVIAVAFFDLLPESLELSKGFYTSETIATFIALGFFIYLLADRILFLHSHSHDHGDGHPSTSSGQVNQYESDGHRGVLGAGSLALHSFFDGVAVGLAFQVSSAVGALVTTAVLIHDFSDGINTVGLILRAQGDKKTAFKWLVVDACAPVLGVLSTMLFAVSQQSFGIILALFTGFFLYIGASDLIPESHHAHPKLLTTVMTLLGAGVLYTAISFAGV